METKIITTKEDERNALTKIRKIVEDLGEGSYVATALKGAFDLAERNISYDAAYNVEEIIAKCEELTEKCNEKATSLAHATVELEKQNDLTNHWMNECEDALDKLDTLQRKYSTEVKNNSRIQKELAEMQAQNTELKARLFDMLYTNKTVEGFRR